MRRPRGSLGTSASSRRIPKKAREPFFNQNLDLKLVLKDFRQGLSKEEISRKYGAPFAQVDAFIGNRKPHANIEQPVKILRRRRKRIDRKETLDS